MLLASLLLAVSSAGTPHIELCRQSFVVVMDTPKPVFGTQDFIETDSCGSGIPFTINDAVTGEAVAHVSVGKQGGAKAHLRIEHASGKPVFERSDIPFGEPVVLRAAAPGHDVDVRVSVFATDARTKGRISIDAHEQPVKTVLRQFQTVSGWNVTGLEHLKDERVTFRFDALSISALLTISASVGGAEVDIGSDGVVVFSPRKTDG
ncbi:MAG TPA: hypothetical protein VLF18_02465 [Tahibacter sp.]|uniref:hypothetical protein n=1 Tax=Tahibacter sp. TaxID=2056211 RepID=UPI002BEC08C4|nr:hypothetical protein [Tahibacter sp.]HSX59041.1 hypothetical protein [Tahibacter sp.]